MHNHPTRRDILKLGGAAAASAILAPALPRTAHAAWKRNRRRPGPVKRRGRSSKNSQENR